MTLALSSQFTQRNYKWTDWKTVQSAKKIIYQYEDDGFAYTIYGYDGPEVHLCTIYKGTVPYAIVDSGYSQSQNDSDKTDFENNFLAAINKTIGARGTLTDRSGTCSLTSTQIMPSNFSRQYLFIQNIGKDVMWINFTSSASVGQGSIMLIPGASFTMEGDSVSTEAINVISTLFGNTFTAKER